MRSEKRSGPLWFAYIALLAVVTNPHVSAGAERRKMSETLLLALRQGQADRVGEIVAAESELLESTGEFGFTPLMLAAFLGNEATLRVLLDAGANVHAINDLGAQALFYAANDLAKN